MAVKVVPIKQAELSLYDPRSGVINIAAKETRARLLARLKDHDKLFEAVKDELDAKREFILWWDAQEKASGERTDLEPRNAAAARQVLHRWRAKVGGDEEHYETVVLPAVREKCVQVCSLMPKAHDVNRVEMLLTVPDGLATLIYADPPWQYSNAGLAGSADSHYHTMPTDKICALGVKDAVFDNAVLFMWATNPLLEDAHDVIDAWGFEYKTNFVWVKDKKLYGKLGFYNYGQHELLLIATRGSFLPEGELQSSLITAPVGEHSSKPDCVYDLIEGMYPSSISSSRELFCRGEGRKGWMKPFGNEAVV